MADSSNHTIRRVTADGVVTTLAGLAGRSASTDGTGSTARFHKPTALAVDPAGTLYVADGSTIRKVTAAGVVTTLAGLAGQPGSADGTGSAARFYWPEGVAVHAAGTVYVADNSNHTVRKVTATGVVTTLAGLAGTSGNVDGTGSAARFRYPVGVAVDSAGTVYVADAGNTTIRRVTAGGVVTTLANLATAGVDGSNALSGLAVDSTGALYVTDRDANTVRRVTVSGVVTTLAGRSGVWGSTDGTGSAARFDDPSGVAVDGAGRVYVVDTHNHAIRKGVPAGPPPDTVASRSVT